MSTKYNRNFTNFQNLSVQGSGTVSPSNVGMVEMAQGLTNEASTVSISMIGSGTNASENSANEHPYFHVSNAGLSIGTGFIRLTAVGSSPYTTIRARTSTYLDTDVALTLPAKSGGIGVTGTFSVDMPAITSWSETAVTVTGIRREDALVVTMQGLGQGTVTTGRTFPFIGAARPENGYVFLTFINPTATATLALTGIICSYTSFR